MIANDHDKHDRSTLINNQLMDWLLIQIKEKRLNMMPSFILAIGFICERM